MVIGEPQILGQIKTAYGYAAEFKTAGLILNRFLHKAFSVAKRVRTETEIASNAVSVSFAAVELARKIFGTLEDKTVLLIGAGEMCELAARHFINNGVTKVMRHQPHLRAGGEAGRGVRGQADPLRQLRRPPAQVDIILTSTGAPNFILGHKKMEEVIRQRKNQPMFLIDIAVPRDIDPQVNDIDNVYLYDVDDLQGVVQANLKERQKEAQKAEGIVDQEIGQFHRWLGNPGRGADHRRPARALRGDPPRRAGEDLLQPQGPRQTGTQGHRGADRGHHQQGPAPADDGSQAVPERPGRRQLRRRGAGPVRPRTASARTEKSNASTTESERGLKELGKPMAKKTLRIGTRASQLALWQANWVKSELEKRYPGLEVTLTKIKTQGDKILDVPLAMVGGKGLFVKEIEEAMLRGEIDIAVHSMKDVPTIFPEGLALRCITEREDPRDIVILEPGFKSFSTCPRERASAPPPCGARRSCCTCRPDFQMVDIRGNVETRIRKLTEDNLDAVILAAAGMNRLGFDSQISEYLPPDISLPAIGQGALGLESRIDDAETNALIDFFNHPRPTGRSTPSGPSCGAWKAAARSPSPAFGTVEGRPADPDRPGRQRRRDECLKKTVSGPRGRSRADGDLPGRRPADPGRGENPQRGLPARDLQGRGRRRLTSPIRIKGT